MPFEEEGTTTITEDVDLLGEGEVEGEEEEVVEPEGEAEGEGEVEGEEEVVEEKKEDEVVEPKAPVIYDRPTIAQLKTEYPDIFKKFPQLREVYFREQQFSQVYPTLDDAKEAAANSENYMELRDTVLSGNAERLFTSVKEADPKALETLSSNLLDALNKVSPDAHWQAILPALESVTKAFYNDGVKTKDDSMKNAALLLSRFLFNDLEVAQGRKSLIKATEKRDPKLDEERRNFETERHSAFAASVYEEGGKGLQRLIGSDKKIDPDGVLSTGMRQYIIDKTIAEVNTQLRADESHMRLMASLWQKAKRDGYKGEWKSSLTTAYLARAKSLIPSIRNKYVSEVLGTSAKSSGKASEKVERVQARREPGTGGRAAKEGGPKSYDARNIDWDKTSDMDLINDNVTLKKG